MSSKRRLRRNGCQGKKLFLTLNSAFYFARFMKREHGITQKPYGCKWCKHFHLTTVGERRFKCSAS